MNRSRQICTFTLGHHCFGIPVDQVLEVLRHQVTTPVPLAPPEIYGLINLRGQIVTVIDLHRRLRLPDRQQRCGINVIVQVGDELISLLVDEMESVQDVDVSQFSPTPDTLRGDQRELITGAYQLPEKLLLVLDVSKVVEVSMSSA